METDKKQEKELVLERKEKYKENLERELALFSEQKPMVEKRRDIHAKMKALISANHKLAIQHFVFKDPKWEYEEQPEYIENVRQLNILNFEKTQMDWESQDAQFDNNLKSIEEQIKTATTELEKVTKEIEELKGEENE